MFKNVSYIYSDLVIELDTSSQSILDCIQKQNSNNRIKILKQSKPYRVGLEFHTNIKYVRNKIII